MAMIVVLFGLVGCQEPDSLPTVVPVVEGVEVGAAETAVPDDTSSTTATATVAPTAIPLPPTATPIPPKELTICMANEPASLYLYGNPSLAATAVRHAVYENLITSLGYEYQAQGVEKVPSLADGDAVLADVAVQAGDIVINASGNPIPLAVGVQIVTSDGEFYTFTEEEETAVFMPQLVVDFTLKPMIWSDGVAVTAVDSVFSFNVAADPLTPGNKNKIERTASYEATGDLSLRWTGVPGFFDSSYFLNVWTPLPSHQLSSITASDMLEAEQTVVFPLSSGPFVVKAWEAGSQILLVQNENYYRETPPPIDNIIILFDQNGLDGVLNGRCDIALQDTLSIADAVDILAASEAGKAAAYFQPSLVFEHIDFGIDSVTEYSKTRPDWFEDVRVRQAVTLCTNRQRMADDLMFGQAKLINAYVDDSHPLFPQDAATYPFDPAAANSLLDEVGFEDTDGDGFRELVEIELGQVVATTTLSITIGTDDISLLRQNINQYFTEDMVACGIQVNPYQVPVLDWYADGPFSPLFGRRFDLATFAWVSNVRPPCNLYQTANITGPEEQGFGGWSNLNATGWSDEAYDVACDAALAALPGTPEYDANHQEAIRIFTEQLPMMPLFSQVKTAVSHPDVINFGLDTTQPSELWNLFELDIEQ